MFGSLPEYIYSISANRSAAGSSVSSGFYVNLFTESVFTFNASTGPLSSPVAAPAPPAMTVPAVKSAPQMSFKLVSPAGGGYYTGESTCVGQRNCPGNAVKTLAACKALCLSLTTNAGNSFESCMGISWTTAPAPAPAPGPPPAPAPWTPRPSNPCVMYAQITKTPDGKPASVFPGAWGYVKCTQGSKAPGCAAFGSTKPCSGTGCAMLPMAKQDAHTGKVFSGKYAITPASSAIKDEVSCNALCIKTADCVQTTWATTAGAPSKRPPAPVIGCEIYHSIDMEVPANTQQDANTQQYVVVGRRIVTQHDFVPAATESKVTAATAVAAGGSTPMKFTQQTDFPYGDGSVTMKLSIPDSSVKTVAVHLRLRIPSWADNPVPVKLNGKALPDAGTAGTYASIDREWSDGDTISLSLSPPLKLTHYTGVDQIKGHEGKRYAVTHGPIVLACVALPGHLAGAALPVLIPASPTAEVSTWLTTDLENTAGFRRSYTIKGVAGYKMVPLWEVPAATEFTTYSVLAGK